MQDSSEILGRLDHLRDAVRKEVNELERLRGRETYRIVQNDRRILAELEEIERYCEDNAELRQKIKETENADA